MNNSGSHISFNTVWIILVSVFFAFMLSACDEPKEQKSIALILPQDPSENAFWLRLQKGAEKAAQESGVELLTSSAHNFEVSSQIDKIKKAIRKKPDGLLIVPPPANSQKLVPVLETEVNIPVVVLDKPLDSTHKNIIIQISFDNKRGGEEIGQWVFKRLKERYQEKGQKGKILILSGVDSVEGKRFIGFKRGLGFTEKEIKEGKKRTTKEGLKIEILDEKSADWDRSRAYEITAKWLRIYSKIDAILTANDNMALGAADAVWKAGRKKIIITGIDGIYAVLQKILYEHIDATMDQKAFEEGYIAVQLMVAHLEYKEYLRIKAKKIKIEEAMEKEAMERAKTAVKAVLEKVLKGKVQNKKVLKGKECQAKAAVAAVVKVLGNNSEAVDFFYEAATQVLEKSALSALMEEKNCPAEQENASIQLWETPLINKNNFDEHIKNKINVVHTGIHVHEITDFNKKDFTVSLDFTLWFWYKDIDEPQNIMFLNAVKPIKLLKQKGDGKSAIDIGPINTKYQENKEGFKYRAYRIKRRFNTNFLPNKTGQPVLGEHVIGLAFRHRKKNQNELLYTPDFIGMNLYKNGLKEQVNDLNVFHLGSNQFIRQAEIFHDITKTDILGERQPDFSSETENLNLLFTKAEFSRLTLAIHIEPFSQRVQHIFHDYFSDFSKNFSKTFYFSPLEYLLFCLFFVLAIIYVVGKKKLFREWFSISTRIKVLWHYYTSKFLSKHFSARGRVLSHNIYTYTVKYLVRPVVWLGVLLMIGGILAVLGILLLSVENSVVQYLSKSMEYEELRLIVLFFGMLWWLIPAYLLVLSIEHFIWRPLEEKTGRKVPRLARHSVTFIVFMLASFGIIAFVFDYTVTGLLATSGLLAMIMGLAMQLNLSNIFSGLALNIEQPFKIGDRVKIGDFDEGEVVEMTWRSTKIRTKDNITLYIPNNQVAQNSIHNFSSSEKQ